MRGKTVLVTGATGFVGGRLIEKLHFDHDVKVKTIVRNFARVSRIARFPLEWVPGSIADREAVDQAVAGRDVVIHCAHDFQNEHNNFQGAKLLAEACLRHGIKRLVHVSSAEVYGPQPEGEIDESTPPQPSGWAHADNKLAVEREFLRYAREDGLPLAVVQPVTIYGPFATYWTVQVVRQLRTGRVALPDQGSGLCNPVYIDDVVDALILAAEHENAIGETFLISGPAPVTWREFYAKYEQIMGVRSVILVPEADLEGLAPRSSMKATLKRLRRSPIAVLGWGPVQRLFPYILPRLSDAFIAKVKQTLSHSWYVPSEHTLQSYRSRSIVRADKARRVLGYEPQFSLDRGMALTAEYIKWARL